MAYYHHDQLGTPLQATDKAGNIVWASSFDAFGRSSITTPQATVDKPTVASNLRLPGQYEDLETGLHYNWHRYYDAEVGRYVTADPIGLEGGINRYSYARGNPMRFTDPKGLSAGGAAIIGATIWGAACSVHAWKKASAAFPDPKDDKKKHCMASCIATKCTALIGGIGVYGAGVAWEYLSPLTGGVFDKGDIDANVEGILKGLNLFGDCQQSCQSCSIQ